MNNLNVNEESPLGNLLIICQRCSASLFLINYSRERVTCDFINIQRYNGIHK